MKEPSGYMMTNDAAELYQYVLDHTNLSPRMQTQYWLDIKYWGHKRGTFCTLIYDDVMAATLSFLPDEKLARPSC